MDVTTNRDYFLNLCIENIQRNGIKELLEWLIETDFFIAPCSTKYHLCERGGLCQHSLNVYQTLVDLCVRYNVNVKENAETITIISLFHDLCKVDFYREELRPVKENNQWVQKKVYVIKDDLPLGHGEKSVMRLMNFMRLTEEEMLAIRWHMGAWDNAVKGGDFSIDAAFKKSKLPCLLHCADMIASNILEK